MTGETATNARKLGYWIATVATAALFVIPGRRSSSTCRISSKTWHIWDIRNISCGF